MVANRCALKLCAGIAGRGHGLLLQGLLQGLVVGREVGIQALSAQQCGGLVP